MLGFPLPHGTRDGRATVEECIAGVVTGTAALFVPR
jgi:hypothetical protein